MEGGLVMVVRIVLPRVGWVDYGDGWLVNRQQSIASANQRIVFDLMERFDWTSATELYLLSNQNVSFSLL